MRYINPKTNFAFKKIFGSTGSQGILRSFLNGILYEGDSRIVSVEIVYPYSLPRLEGMKDSYLDVWVVLDDGQRVIIEMQVLNVPGMEKRVLYNAAKEYSNQLIKGQDYRLLNPVIALTLTDFIMFPELEGQVISRFALAEKDRLIAYPDGDVELVFVELPKFERGLHELRGLTDEWLFFVDCAADLDAVPAQLSAVAEIEDAFEIAETSRLTPEEDHALELKTRWIADQKMILEMKLGAEAQLEMAEAQLEQVETKLEQVETKLEHTETKLELTASKLEHTETKLELTATQLEQQTARAEHILRAATKALAAAGLDDAAIAAQLGITPTEVPRLRL